MIIETNHNFTQSYPPPTSPPTQNNVDNALAELVMYLLAIMCAENDTCSDVFEVVCACLFAIASLTIATQPIKALRYQKEEQNVAKLAMLGLLGASIWGGGYAGRKQYSHYLYGINDPDFVEKLSAFASGALGGAVVTTAFTAISAGTVHCTTPYITRAYNRAKDTFNRMREACTPESHDHYERLEAGRAPANTFSG